MSNATQAAEHYREKYEDYIGKLVTQIRELKEQNGKLEELAFHGELFQMMMTAVNENALVKKEWERFMMTLRMTGYDSTGK